MSRRDFELIAGVIAASRGVFASNTAHAAFAACMADNLASTNPAFDRALFIRAAMPRAWVGTRHETAWKRQARRA